MALRVKIFERVTHGGVLEADVNHWLTENPNVQVRDIRMSATPIEGDRGVPDFGVFCIVLYEE